jgi:hypothetical protein
MGQNFCPIFACITINMHEEIQFWATPPTHSKATSLLSLALTLISLT